MTETTPLDLAHAEMAARGSDETARVRFFGVFAAAELFLLLERDAEDDRADPVIFEVASGRFAVAFDSEARLADSAGGPAPYAALSGRVLAPLLSSEGLGVLLNPGVGPSENLIDANAIAWLANMLTSDLGIDERRPSEIAAPRVVPEAVLHALDRAFSSAEGRAAHAYLVAATYDGGGEGDLICVVDPLPGAEGAIAHAVQQALTFSGLEAASLDVAFFRASDPALARIAKVGLRFDLPDAPEPEPLGVPGTDPDRPPKLR
ncbi:MAG: SseB family protein [Pseudomonadota bacterium]